MGPSISAALRSIFLQLLLLSGFLGPFPVAGQRPSWLHQAAPSTPSPPSAPSPSPTSPPSFSPSPSFTSTSVSATAEDDDDTSPWPPPSTHITFSTSFDDNKCGLMNQHMMLTAFLTVAIALRPHTVVIPLALSRDTFESPTPGWLPQPASSLWDLHSIAALLRRHDIALVVSTANSSIPPHAAHLHQHHPAESLDTIAHHARRTIRAHLRLPAAAPRPAHLTAPPSAALALAHRIKALATDASRLLLSGLTTSHPPAPAPLPDSAPAPPAAPLTLPGAPAPLPRPRDASLPRSLSHHSMSHPASHQSFNHSVWLHADNLFWMLVSDARYTAVARALHFNLQLVGLADAAAAALRAATPAGEYHALHLRIEKDWTQFFSVSSTAIKDDLQKVARLMCSLRFLGDPDCPSDESRSGDAADAADAAAAAAAADAAKYSSTVPMPRIYVASAIFDPATGELDTVEYPEAEAWLARHVGGGRLANRQTVLRGVAVSEHPILAHPGLHSEQAALVDFLIMQRATKAIGFGRSSFSFNMREYRALAGHPRNSTALFGEAVNIERYEHTAGLWL